MNAERFLALALAVVSGVLLGLAAWLQPDPSGIGTHMQLGLGGCSVLSETGWPCPMCGMTTTFALGLDGRILAAFKNQPFGVFLLSGTICAFFISTAEFIRPRSRLARCWGWIDRNDTAVAICLLFGLVFGWLYKCWRVGVF